ncbi:hypothetical protein OS493_033839 [Desmophyllum pertusum]|uniref:Uncharacterized protein n=1 Tax=Desmophyllum pertusum TaxID=174260 RepID=A0A9W9YIU5_9CNID|nr:hypothetical protein OS493_033839 [Desmophyllum pertusum]
MVSNFAREAEDLAIPAREFASLQSAVARQAGQRSPHFELFCPPFWIFVKDFQKVEQNERRFMEEFACTLDEAADATNGRPSHGRAAWFERMASTLERSNYRWQA